MANILDRSRPKVSVLGFSLKEIVDLVDFGIPVDIIVYTPDEFARLKDSNSGFWKSFHNDHLQLIQPTAKA